MQSDDPTYPSKRIRLGKKLRRESTKYEKRLWYECLRYFPVRFRRQVPIGPYIIDFYSQQARLAIELDGAYHRHDEQAVEDRERSAWLNAKGITVLRFSNKEIVEDPNAVYAIIKSKLLDLGFEIDQ